MMKVIILLLCLLLVLPSQAQEHEDIVFEEEFVAVEAEEPVPAPTQQPSSPQTPPPAAPREPFQFSVQDLQRYRYELLGVSMIFFYLILYARGKRMNVEIMERFYRRVDGFLEDNFAHIGFSKTSGEIPFNGESASQTLYYATGRDNVDGIEMRFNTKKRHDLIYTLYDLVVPEKDIITIDLPMQTNIPLVFAVVPRRKVKQMTEANLDVKKLTGHFRINNLSEAYQVLGESAESVDSIIDNHVVKRLNEMVGLFVSIHFTDLQMHSKNPGHLRVVLNATHKNQDHFLPGMELILYLADKIAGYKMPNGLKTAALKYREEFNKSKEKEELEKHNEELRKQKEEKLRKEEAWLRSLPPEKQKKEEEKRKKKEFNKMMKGKTMKVA